jgi:hypothetical protein
LSTTAAATNAAAAYRQNTHEPAPWRQRGVVGVQVAHVTGLLAGYLVAVMFILMVRVSIRTGSVPTIDALTRKGGRIFLLLIPDNSRVAHSLRWPRTNEVDNPAVELNV